MKKRNRAITTKMEMNGGRSLKKAWKRNSEIRKKTLLI
jgi:hypothetical protein